MNRRGTEPYARWCGRTAGAIPPPTRFQDKVRPGTGREGALGYERYIAIEHMDVRRDCFSFARYINERYAAGAGMRTTAGMQEVDAGAVTEEWHLYPGLGLSTP